MRWEFIFLLVLVFLAGCEMIQEDFTPTGKVVAKEDIMAMCSAEVMICPDGSFVGRDPAHNCSFKACPSDGYGDPSEGWHPEDE